LNDGDEDAFGDEQALSLIQVFHKVTGQVVEEGLLEDQSAAAIAHAYTDCVVLYQRGLYDRGWDSNSEIWRSGILDYTLKTLTMTCIVAQKKERYHLKQQGLMAEVLKEHSDLSSLNWTGNPCQMGLLCGERLELQLCKGMRISAHKLLGIGDCSRRENERE